MSAKVAIVTGAAKGIGAAISARMIADGFITILVDIDDDRGHALALSFGKNAYYFHCNIVDEKAVAALFEMIVDRFTTIDVLVNNAGIIKDNFIWKMPSSDFDQVVEVNLKGTWLMCKYAALRMKARQNGRIVNIASRAWLGNAGQTNYSSSKAGIIGLTRALALELGRYGIVINAVAPGLIDTPLSQNLTEEIKQRLIETQPIKSMGQPEDVAQAVSFLSNKDTQFITGQTLYVDGGKSIGAGI